MRQVFEGNIYFYDYRKTLGVEAICGKNVRHDFSRHTHRTLCIGVVEQGVRIFLFRGERCKIVSGQVFVIPPDEAHSCGSEGEPHTYRLLLISPDTLHTILPKTEEDSYIYENLVISDKKQFEQLLNLHAILASDETSFLKQSVLSSTIGDIVKCCTGIDKDLKISNKHYDSVKRVQSFIEIHYAENFSLNDIARHAYLSPYYLIRVFSQIIGIPPHIYQQQVRIRQAKELLIQGVPIVDAAIQTGFTDQSHFSNVFKKMVGITPGGYAKSFLLQ